MNKKALKMEDAFKNALIHNRWKGNIRELKNVIERAVILSNGNLLTSDCLPFDFLYDAGGNEGVDSFKITKVEHNHIKKVLAFTNGNKTKTAELLGIGVTTLYRKIEEYGI